MFQLLKKIFVIISATMLVIASGGFSLYQHYCSCEGDVYNSIIVESTDCNEANEIQSCCSVPEEKVTSCCETDANQNNSHSLCGDDDSCCTSEVSFLKTDEFNYSFDEKKSFQFITAFVNIIEAITFQNIDGFTKETNFIADLPPPDYGIRFLITHHQLKIAPPIA